MNIFQRYVRTGGELGQAVRWSQLSGDMEHLVIGSMRGGELLYVANDRIVWNAGLHKGSRT